MIQSALIFECMDRVGETPEEKPCTGRSAVFLLTEYQYGLLVDALRSDSQRKRGCGLSGTANDLDNMRRVIVESRNLARG